MKQQHQAKNGDETRTDGEEVTGVGRGEREGVREEGRTKTEGVVIVISTDEWGRRGRRNNRGNGNRDDKKRCRRTRRGEEKE